MVLAIYGKKAPFMLKPDELHMYWCLWPLWEADSGRILLHLPALWEAGNPFCSLKSQLCPSPWSPASAFSMRCYGQDGWERPQVATAPASYNPLPATPELCPACECLLISVCCQFVTSPWRITVELLSLILFFLRCLPLRRNFLLSPASQL